MFYENKDANIYISESNSLAYPAHLHHHIELVYMLEGHSQAFVDSTTYDLYADDLFISFPNQVHYYQKVAPEKSIVLIFSPDLCSEYKPYFTSSIPASPVIRSGLHVEKIRSILQNITEQSSLHSPYSSFILKGYLLVLLGELFPLMDLQPTAASNTDTLKQILLYCSQNYTKELNLETLERSLHISKYRISHLFNEKLKLGFKDYINMLRISHACSVLLSEDMNITDVAYYVGFSTPRSFNRSFIKYTGTTPRDYRKKHSVH